MWRQQLLLLLMLLLMLFLMAHAAVSEDKHNQAPVLALPKTISLRDGAAMPRVGLGVALTAEQTYEAVTHAITLVGYTLVDTAAEESYGNEDQVGRALSDYYRNHHHHQETHNNSSNNNNNNNNAEEKSIFVTTKLWDSDHGFYSTLRAFWKSYQELNKFVTTGDNDNNDGSVSASDSVSDKSNKNSYIPIDLYLVHSPFGGRLVETWDALLWLQKHQSDKVISIGVSNFGIDHLEVVHKAGRPMPVVNQIEMHPLVFSQRQELLAYCHEHNIQIQAFGSLLHGYSRFLTNPPPLLSEMVDRYNTNGVDYVVYHSTDDENYNNKNDETTEPSSAITVAHVLLQWALQHGFAIIPKSSKTLRITENVRYLNLGNTERKQPNSNENNNKNENSNENRPDFFLSKHDMELLDQWGDHVPYEHRNVYKTDWNWNPIDEAPLHSGSEDYWPGYEDLENETNLERLLEKIIDVLDDEDDEEEYWEEYWGNEIHLDDDDEDYDDNDEKDEDELYGEEFHEEL
jgi:diketogulonate reductase-like aldo/keto reductase